MTTYLCTVTAQLSSKSYKSTFDQERIQTSSPGTAARMAINSAKKKIARKKVDNWTVQVIPVRG